MHHVQPTLLPLLQKIKPKHIYIKKNTSQATVLSKRPVLQLGNQSDPHTTNSLVILPKRTQLEEPIARAPHESAPLVRQIDKVLDAKAVDEVVHDDSRVGVLGLAHDMHGARVIEEEVMHQAAPPGSHTMRATESNIAHEGVTAAVKVAGIVVAAETVLL